MVLSVDQAVLAYKEKHTTICPGQQHPSSSHSGKVAMPVKVVGVGSTVTWQGEPQVHQTASLVGPPVRRPPPHCSLSTLSCKPVFKHSSMIKPNRCTVKQRTRQSPLRSLMMLAALSLHSVFEGLSVGLQETTPGVLSVFGAIMLHKCIIAFCIGLNLVQSNLSFWAVVKSNAVFCISTPVGIAIGIFVMKFAEESSANTANGILQGLACGTFLYVAFFVMLPHEFNNPGDRGTKTLFVFIGIVIVNAVLILEIALKKT